MSIWARREMADNYWAEKQKLGFSPTASGFFPNFVSSLICHGAQSTSVIRSAHRAARDESIAARRSLGRCAARPCRAPSSRPVRGGASGCRAVRGFRATCQIWRGGNRTGCKLESEVTKIANSAAASQCSEFIFPQNQPRTGSKLESGRQCKCSLE